MRITFRRRLRGQDPQDEDVDWPTGWPLPDQGASFLGHVLAGWVEYVEFDVPAQRILVVLR